MNRLAVFSSEETYPESDQEAREFVDDINYLIEEGLVELVEDRNGNIRLYPVGE